MQRDELGLGASGKQKTWLFGLRRMLQRYGSGDAGALLDPLSRTRLLRSARHRPRPPAPVLSGSGVFIIPGLSLEIWLW